jgi:outer membrane protein assembly factor BamB
MLRTLILLVAISSVAPAADWPQFRGPTGDGHYGGPKLPADFGPDKNVAWKTPIPGLGWSSPIIAKGKVYLTTAVEKAKGEQSLRALCLNAETGKIEWEKEVFVQSDPAITKKHDKNSHASPTPATDGERLYVHFGPMGTAALDLTGKVLWNRTGLYAQSQHGSGGSPIVVDGLLLFSCDAIDKQFVIALHAKDGKTAWQTPRGNGGKPAFSFSTPTLLEIAGKKAIISEGSDMIAAYDVKGGKEIWRSKFTGYSLIPKPVVGHGMVYFSTGYGTPSFMAVKLGGNGDVTASHAGWKVPKVAPHTPSPILSGNELFMVSDFGIMSCLDAKTGEVLWSEKRANGKGFSASPIIADGKVYFTSEDGKGTVIEASRTYKSVGEFDLKERTFASFAAVDGAIYARTETQLYKFASR